MNKKVYKDHKEIDQFDDIASSSDGEEYFMESPSDSSRSSCSTSSFSNVRSSSESSGLQSPVRVSVDDLGGNFRGCGFGYVLGRFGKRI